MSEHDRVCRSSYFHVRFTGLVLPGNLFSMGDPPLIVPLFLFGMHSGDPLSRMSSMDL